MSKTGFCLEIWALKNTHLEFNLDAVGAKWRGAFFSVLEGFFKDKNEKDLGNFYVIHI